MLNAADPLRVAFLGVSSHNRAILEFFFANAGKHLFRLVPLDEPQVLIADFDQTGTQQAWEDNYSAAPRPGIALAMQNPNIERTIWVAKPLTMQALGDAAAQVRPLLPEGHSDTPRDTPNTPPDAAHTDTTATSKISNTVQPFGLPAKPKRPQQTTLLVSTAGATAPSPSPQDNSPEHLVRPRVAHLNTKAPPSAPLIDPDQQEQRWQQLCGDHGDIEQQALPHSPELLFSPDNHLLGHLQQALHLMRQSNQPVHIDINQGQEQLLMLPTTQQVYSSLDKLSEDFMWLCHLPMAAEQVQLSQADPETLARLEDQLKGNKYNLEALLWTASLLTARGRLSRTMPLEQSLILNYWPNLTRLESTPHNMRIAAIWYQRAGTVFEIAAWLDIPQRYVFAFHTAASTLGLLIADQGQRPRREPTTAPQKNRGLFSRLLQRLLGGGTR